MGIQTFVVTILCAESKFTVQLQILDSTNPEVRGGGGSVAAEKPSLSHGLTARQWEGRGDGINSPLFSYIERVWGNEKRERYL